MCVHARACVCVCVVRVCGAHVCVMRVGGMKREAIMAKGECYTSDFDK